MEINAGLAGVGVTAVLGAAFWFPAALRHTEVAPRLDGRTIVEPSKAASIARTSITPAWSLPSPKAGPAVSAAKKAKGRRFSAKKREKSAPPMPAAVTSSSGPAISARLPPAAEPNPPPVPEPDDSLTFVAKRFESDPSVYPLEAHAAAREVRLEILGIESLEKGFVAKVRVANERASDFYVEGFAVEAAGRALVSRAYFSVLVEAGNERQGYVVFARPDAAAKVRISLKEAGSGGAVVRLAIPYEFE